MRASILGAGVASVTACSVLLDWSGYTGGLGLHGDGGDDAAPVGCGTDQQCAVLPDAGGWEGPIALYRSDGVPPQCASNYQPYFVVDASISCSPCTCGTPEGGTCASPTVTFYSDPNCKAGTACDKAPLITNACTKPAACGQAFDIGSPVPEGGTCAPDGGVPTKPSPFVLAARACPDVPPVPQGSCAAGQVCLPTAAAPTAPRVCIRHTGEVPACPAGSPYQYGPELYYTDPDSATDTRACTACTCEAPGTASCGYGGLGPIDFRYNFDGMNCTIVPAGGFSIPSACSPLNGQGLQTSSAPDYDAGHCFVDGGLPQGTVTPTGAPTTFCCTSQAP